MKKSLHQLLSELLRQGFKLNNNEVEAIDKELISDCNSLSAQYAVMRELPRPINEMLAMFYKSYDKIVEGKSTRFDYDQLKAFEEELTVYESVLSLTPDLASNFNAKELEAAFALLDTGNWQLTRIVPVSWMSDAAYDRGLWSVSRTTAPYCSESHARSWEGHTPFEALKNAHQDLGIQFPY